MTWSRAGTVSVTQNSNAVIGTGTAFIGDSRVGDAFIGPDGALYEVTNIASNTALAIAPAYKGASSAAGVYALAPIQGYNKSTADALRAASLQVGDALDGLEESVAEAAASAVTATAAKEVVLVNAATASDAASAAASSESHVVTLASAVEEDASSSAAAAASALASKEAAAISEANAAASAGAVANALIKTGGTMSGALNLAPIVSIASSANPAIGAAAANTITITGTIGITGFDVIASGAVRTLIFVGVVTLTHHATKLILPKGSNVTTAAGDVLQFTSLGGGNWRCTGKLVATDPDIADLGFGYISGDLSWTNGGVVTVNHGMPAKPSKVTIEMVCVIAQGGFAVGTVLPIGGFSFSVSGTDGYGHAAYITDTQIAVHIISNGIQLWQAVTNASVLATPANWRFRIRASKS